MAKGDRTTGRDGSGNLQSLFNPHEFEPWLLGWHLHFVLDRDSGIIRSRTDVGEATIGTLNMNAANRVFARKLQIQAGLIS